ncbi:MAG: hypothetical protein LIQ31_09340 [Planctomycetes bacterium]|nr:hypothetical protein [Planctomycetota bacterium]
MKTFSQKIVIPPDRKVTIELPDDVPTGHVIITFTVDPEPPSKNNPEKGGIAILRGLGKGHGLDG